MPLMTLILLALIQGVTEFLPISSSAHLILFPAVTGAEDQGVALDAAVHVGTLAAVMLFFRREVAGLIRGLGHLAAGRRATDEARLVWLLGLATVPVVILGAVLAATGWVDLLRSAEVIAWTTIIFAITLWLGDRFGPQRTKLTDLRLGTAAVMGLAQAISLIPGVSRSGITLTTARALGFERVEAGRLALLMSIPATMAVAGYLGLKLLREGDTTLGLDALIAAVLAFFAALAALAVLMRMLRTWTLTPFVIYRLCLGAALMVWVYG